jgi:hypothetical protein
MAATQLTPTQLTALAGDIAGNANTVTINGVATAISAVGHGADNAQQVANWYNLTRAPAWTVWKKAVTVKQVGDAINSTELAGLTSLNTQRLQTLAQYTDGTFDFSLADRRNAFNDIFSGAGGATTRASLLVLWKRLATNAQKLFSSGTGSDPAPATTDANVGDSFALTAGDVLAAWGP